MTDSPTVDFAAILETLSANHVDFVVVGGVSAVLNGAPISTFDLDIVHSRAPENIDRLLQAGASGAQILQLIADEGLGAGAFGFGPLLHEAAGFGDHALQLALQRLLL